MNLRTFTAFFYVLQLVSISAVLDGCMQSHRILDRDRGLASLLPRILPGMEIRNGKLFPHRKTPYVPSKRYVASLFVLLSPGMYETADFKDSIVVVDTSRYPEENFSRNVRLVLGRQAVFLNYPPVGKTHILYSDILDQNSSLAFNKEEVQSFFSKRRSGIFLLTGFQHFITMAFNIGFVMCFLALAAYIFKKNKACGYGGCLKMACFAVSPLAIGRILVVLSATRSEWIWHVTIAVSTIIMFRGVRAIGRDNDKDYSVESKGL